MIGSVGGWVWTQTQDSVDQNGGKRKIDSYRKQGIQWQKTQRTQGKETYTHGTINARQTSTGRKQLKTPE